MFSTARAARDLAKKEKEELAAKKDDAIAKKMAEEAALEDSRKEELKEKAAHKEEATVQDATFDSQCAPDDASNTEAPSSSPSGGAAFSTPEKPAAFDVPSVDADRKRKFNSLKDKQVHAFSFTPHPSRACAHATPWLSEL
jgi:hypothetical protein